MTTLPYDYTHCINNTCQRRQQCLRYLSSWRGQRQWMAVLNCSAPRWDNYIPIDRAMERSK